MHGIVKNNIEKLALNLGGSLPTLTLTEWMKYRGTGNKTMAELNRLGYVIGPLVRTKTKGIQ